MSNTPLVSVIIPTYNRSQELVKALDSVIMQDYRPIEIIVIDDHGNDDTRHMLDHYHFADVKYTYIYNQINLGPGRARNVGMKMAQGEYIAFLDSDDYWIVPDKITQQVLFLENNADYSFIATKWIVQDEYLDNGGCDHFFLTDQDFRKIALYYYSAHTSTWLFRKEIFDKIGGFWKYKTEDYEYLLRIGIFTKCFCLPINSELHSNTMSGYYQKNIIRQWFWGLIICIKYRNHYPSFYRAISHRFFRAIYKGFKRFIFRL